MKGINPLLSFVLVVLITITAIGLVLEFGLPGSERAKEILLLQEGKNILTEIDNSVRTVSYQGEGSTVNLRLTITDGSYIIDNQTEEITFIMDSIAQIVGVGVTTHEGNLNITGTQGSIEVLLYYDDVDIVNRAQFGKGIRTLIIKNNGWNSTSQKQMIDITVS